MQENTTLYRIGLSLAGALVTGFFGLLVGLVWGAALDLDFLVVGGVLAAAGAVIGAITFQLTPTGGVIMENKTTVNYAMVSTYGYMASFCIIAGLIVWGVLSLAS